MILYKVIYSNPFYGGYETSEFQATSRELCNNYIEQRIDGTLLERDDFYIAEERLLNGE